MSSLLRMLCEFPKRQLASAEGRFFWGVSEIPEPRREPQINVRHPPMAFRYPRRGVQELAEIHRGHFASNRAFRARSPSTGLRLPSRESKRADPWRAARTQQPRTLRTRAPSARSTTRCRAALDRADLHLGSPQPRPFGSTIQPTFSIWRFFSDKASKRLVSGVLQIHGNASMWLAAGLARRKFGSRGGLQLGRLRIGAARAHDPR